MGKQAYEFTLVLSGLPALTREVLDSLYEAGCDDALIGMRDGVAFADFCRAGRSFGQAVLSAVHDVEGAGIGARIEHIEPDELVTMSEIARRLQLSREGIRKWVAGLRGPGIFPPPVGSLNQRSPLWRWTDVVLWHQTVRPGKQGTDRIALVTVGSEIAAWNAALDLLRRVSLEEAIRLLQTITAYDKRAKSKSS
jgi:hypothetical protein